MSDKSEYIAFLLKAIQTKYGCVAAHCDTVPVHEMREGKSIWNGNVEVFELAAHPLAKRCYAWYERGTSAHQDRLITMLQKGFILSPQTAVKARMAAKRVTIYPLLWTDLISRDDSEGSRPTT